MVEDGVDVGRSRIHTILLFTTLCELKRLLDGLLGGMCRAVDDDDDFWSLGDRYVFAKG